MTINNKYLSTIYLHKIFINDNQNYSSQETNNYLNDKKS